MDSNGDRRTCLQGEVSRRRSAFSLIELLTVIFIISLLISILVPSLSAARTQAKNLKVSATLNAIGAAMEMFRTENEKEFRVSNGYPPSGLAVDTTETGAEEIYGAHWLARMLMGKDLQGFIPRRNVPPSMRNPGADDEQEFWYDASAYNGRPLDRGGPYLNPDSVEIRLTRELPGTPPPLSEMSQTALDQIVLVDVFGYPILGYTANPLARGFLARDFPESPDTGTFTHEDNIGFTGSGVGLPGWDFGAGNLHPIAKFGFPKPENIADEGETDSFCYYILDKKAYESTLDDGVPTVNTTAKAVRRDSFILIAAGKDALYGSSDDVVNFNR